VVGTSVAQAFLGFLNEGAAVVIADFNEANGMAAANQPILTSRPTYSPSPTSLGQSILQ
jgi:hypothetical protein